VINNDYVRGYFDAHGRVDRLHSKGSHYLRIKFQEQHKAVIEAVIAYLRAQGYRVSTWFGRSCAYDSRAPRYHAQIARQDEVRRFRDEIGTEIPKWQDRFNELA